MSRYKTPLRYPGGKQKLSPFLGEIISANSLVGGDYVEPYAGGAGIAIELLLSDQVAHIHLNDRSKPVYDFWRAILARTDEFCRRISCASMSIPEWRRQKQIVARPGEFEQIDVGFAFFYLNRCNRSGIVTGGLIGGLHQSGDWRMDARFPRNELIRRIEAIALKRQQISVKNWDAERFLKTYVRTLPKQTLVYCDPPYYNQSDRLYLNHYGPDDHARIAKLIQRSVKHTWIVSYDNVTQIRRHYRDSRSLNYSLQYNAAKAYQGREVMFFSKCLKLPTRSHVKCINSALIRRR